MFRRPARWTLASPIAKLATTLLPGQSTLTEHAVRPPDTPTIDATALDHVVSIHYYGRSGSVFLQSLLDDHPQVAMLPALYLVGFYAFWESIRQMPAMTALAHFLDAYEVLFDPGAVVGDTSLGTSYGLDRMGDEGNERLGLDKRALSDALLHKLALVIEDFQSEPLPRRFFFQALHAAYAEVLGRRLQGGRALLVHQGHVPEPENLRPLADDFRGRIKFLHCVREPVQTLASHYLGTGRSEQWRHLDLPRRLLCESLDFATPMAARGKPGDEVWEGCESRAVRLEDLHTKPRETLEKVAAWVGIEWHENLLHSTFDGKLWTWRSDDTTVQGFQRQTIAKRHRGTVTPFDRLRLKLLLADKYAAWGYDIGWLFLLTPLRLAAFVLWIWPFRFETRLWRRRQPWDGSTLATIAGEYLRLRRQVVSRWWRGWRRREALIELL
mgnify:CR=1 FL=1|tara:strand:- start:820 stop:2139 length:1320 start_codon:yes stop_codon:yes gene_type:complete